MGKMTQLIGGVTDKEARLTSLFVGMFIDQKIPKDRMLKLCAPDKLDQIYDFIVERKTS
jgi:hypothetical protein